MPSKIKSATFVTLQFVFLGYLLLTTNIYGINIFSVFLISLGGFVGMWAIYTMRKSVLRITPDVDKKATLVADGPYRFIRHPMYLALIVAGLGLLLSNMTVIRIFVYLFLIADLLFKLNFEERLLDGHFKNYKKYKEKTFKVIPYVY